MDFKLSLNEFLEKNEILSLASTDGKNTYVCNLHYSSDESFNLYFASTHNRKHSSNIENGFHEVAIAIYDPSVSNNTILSGVQMRGYCEKYIITGTDEINKFYKKFPGKFNDEKNEAIINVELRVFYKFTPKRIRMIDGHSWELFNEITL